MSAGDFVLATVRGEIVVGELWFFASVDGRIVACLSVWEPMLPLDPPNYHRNFRTIDAATFVDCDSCVLGATVAYLLSDDGCRATVSLPSSYRFP